MNEYKWKSHIARFLSAQTISLLGSSIVQYAIIWYITLTTSSGKMITLSTLCGFLPQILISLFAGVWIDRYSRKGIVMITDCFIASATLILDTVDKSVVLWYNEEKRTEVFLHGEQLSTARYVRCDVGNSQAVHNRKQGNVGRERKGYPSISEWRVLDFENGSTMERPAAGIW